MATQDIYNAVLEIDNTYSDRFSLQEFEENMQDEGFATAVQEVVGDTVKKKDESDGILEEEVTESTIEEEPLPTSSESLEESDSFEPYNPDQFGEFIQDEAVEETPSPSPEFDIDPKAQEYFAEVDKRNKQAWSGVGSPMTNEDKNKLRVEMGVEEVVPVATDYIQVEEGGLTPLNEQVNDLIQQEANKKGRGFTESDENIQQIIKLGKALYDEEQKKWKEASERISKTEKNESVAKEKKRQLEVSQSMDFKNSLDGLSDILSNPDMFYSKDSKKIWDRRKLIPELTKQYGKYDLIFSNGGLGDMINVSTSKGKDETISLINRDGSFELSPLKDFIAQNASIDSYFMDETIDATEQHYDEFMAERGFNGKGIRKAVNDLEFVRDKLALAEKLASADWNFTDHKEAYVEKYPDLFVEASIGGKGKHMIPRSDLKSIIEKLEVEEDQLDDLVGENFSHNLNDDILKAQQDWDVVSADRRKELSKTFAQSNEEAQVTQKKVQYDSFMYFNKSMFKDGKLNISPEDIKTEEDEKKFLGFYDQYMDAAVARKTASDAYRDANTYLSLQKNKNIKGAYLGEMDGLWANIDKNLALGRAQKAFGELSAYREDTDEDIKRGAAQEIVKQMGLSESFGESRALSEMHSVKGLMNNVAAWARNPAEISFGFFTGSMSMMLPYGKYLVLGGLATGAASGAAKGWFVGGPKGSLAGGLAGGIWGARSGMAAAAFGMEYTNALIAALTSKGYNIKDASSVEKALGDAEVWSEGMEIGIKRGIPISVIDFLSAGAAGKLFSAGKHMTASTRKRVAMLAAEQAVWGPVAEAVGEGAAMLAAGQELSAVDMFHESIGAFGGNFSNIAYNIFQRTSQSAKIEYAENLRDINAVLSDNVNLKDLSSWINKMKLLGQIDAETAHTIEQNIGIKREVTSIMDTDFAHDFWDRALNPEVGEIKNRLGQLLNAKKQIDTPNERVYNSANISAINKEINEITSTGKMPKNPIQLTNTKVEYSVNGKKLNREQMATYLDTASPEQLLLDNIEINNPSPAMMEKLTNADKKVQDAIQKSSTESVDALQQAEDGSTVGVGDTKGSQVTEATQKENDKVGATKDKTTKEVLTEAGKKIVKATDRWAAGLKKEGEKKGTKVEDHSPIGAIPIRNRGSATTDPEVLSGIEAKSADNNIERSIINGIKRGDSAQTIIDRVLSQYGFLSNQNEAIADYIRDRVSGKTTTKFDVWRKPKESVDTKAEVGEENETNKTIDRAREGDKEAQAELEEYGIDWKKETLYRFISDKEAESLQKGEQIKGKHEGIGVDVTVKEEGSSGQSNDVRITFKEEFDFNKEGNRSKRKNDVDGWIEEGYTMDDVAVIEKRNENGTWTKTYEAKESVDTKAEVEEVEKKGRVDNNKVTLKEETFTVTDEEGGTIVYKIQTMLDGSLKGESKQYDADGNLIHQSVKVTLPDTDIIIRDGITAEKAIKMVADESGGDIVEKTGERSGTEVMNPKKLERLTNEQRSKLGLAKIKKAAEKKTYEAKESILEDTKKKGKAVIETEVKATPEDVEILSLINDSDLLTPEEKKMLYRQYRRGVMTKEDIQKHTTLDIDKLNEKDLDKWGRVILDKLKKRQGKPIGEEVDFSDVEEKKGKGRLQVENQSVKIRNLETDLGLRKDNILKRYLRTDKGHAKALAKAQAINQQLRDDNSPFKAAITNIPGERGDNRTYYAVNLEPREERGRLQVESKKIPSKMGPTKKAPVKSGAIEGLKKLDKSAKTADQWIVGIAEKGGKGTMAELDAMGLDAFLKEYEKQNKGASIPRQVVADYMKANPVDISEITEEYNVADTKVTLYPEVEKIFSEGYLPTLAKYFKEKFANKAKSIMDKIPFYVRSPKAFIEKLMAQMPNETAKQIIKELKEMSEGDVSRLPKRIREVLEKASLFGVFNKEDIRGVVLQNFEGLFKQMIEHVEVGGEKQYERYVQPGKASNYRNILLTDPATVAAKEDFSIVPYEEEEMQGAFEVRMSIVDTNYPTLDAQTQKRHTDTVSIGGPFLSYEEAQEFIDSGNAQDRAIKSTPQHISQGDPHFRGKGEMPKKLDFKQLSVKNSAKIRKLINKERDINGERLFVGQENAKTLRVFKTTTAIPTSLFPAKGQPAALYIVEEKIGDEKFFSLMEDLGKKLFSKGLMHTLDEAKAEANRQLKLEIENVTETAEQNLLSHTRVSDRNIGGKKTLFVEEIQSQRAQNLTPNKAHRSDAVDAAFKPHLKRSERIKLEGLDKDITKEMESLETYQAIKENFGKVINAEAIQKQIDKLNFPKEITGKRIADYMFGRILNAVEDGVIDYDTYHNRTQMGSARKGYGDAIQSSISTVLKHMMETEFLSEIITKSNSSLLLKERPKDINISEWKETTPDDIKVADAFFKWKSIPTSIIENLLQTYQNEQKDYSDVVVKVLEEQARWEKLTLIEEYIRKKRYINSKAEVKKEIQKKGVRPFLEDVARTLGNNEDMYLQELQYKLIRNNLMYERAFPSERPKAKFHRKKNVKEALDSGFQDFRLAPIEKMLERDEIYRGLGRGTSPQMSHAKTEQWLGLNLRRLLKEAVDNGDEQIVFANADQVQDIVGGAIEGQRKFYNEMLPRQLRDELKRLDKNAKVKRIAVPEEIDGGRGFGKLDDADLAIDLIETGKKAGILEKDAPVTAENLDKTVNSIKIDEYLDPIIAETEERVEKLQDSNLQTDKIIKEWGDAKDALRSLKYLKNLTDGLSRSGNGVAFNGETIDSLMEAYSNQQRGQTVVAVEITPGLKEALKESITKFQINKKKGKERRSDIKIITDKLKAAFPSVEVATDGASFDKIMAEEGIRERKFNGEKVLGITKGGKIWINPDTKTITTPIHEFGHIWVDYLRDESSGIKGTKLLEKGLSLVDPKSAEYKNALEIYGEYEDGKLINEELVREETLVEMIATKGETIANESKRKDFKSWINDMFEFIKKHLTTTAKFLKDKVWAAKIEALTIEEFTDMALADLFAGEPPQARLKTVLDSEKPSKVKDLFRKSPRALQKIVMAQWNAKQNEKYHPEGNTLKHIIVVTNRALAKYPDNPNMAMAAYFHDLGKMDTYAINPKTGKPTAYGHEKVSERLVRENVAFIKKMGADPKTVAFIVKNHMRMKPNVWGVMRESKKKIIMDSPYFAELEEFATIDRGGVDIDKPTAKARMQIVGERANLPKAAIDSLGIAKMFEKAGLSSEEIWQGTGWQRGKEGKWRYEIPYGKVKPDALAKILEADGVVSFTLDEVWDAPDLKKAYPALFDKDNPKLKLDLEIQPNMSEYGSYRPGHIEMGVKSVEQLEKTLVHEIQHAVQKIEGFARGGNLSISARLLKTSEKEKALAAGVRYSVAKFLTHMFEMIDSSVKPEVKAKLRASDIFNAKFLLNNFSEELQEVFDVDLEGLTPEEATKNVEATESGAKYVKGIGLKNLTDKTPQQLAALLAEGIEEDFKEENKIADSTEAYELVNYYLGTGADIDVANRDYQSIVDTFSGLMDEYLDEWSEYSNYKLYERLAGESEARNVEKRSRMPKGARRSRSLESTEDISRDKQIVISDEVAKRIGISNRESKARKRVEQNLDLFGEPVPEGKGRPKRKSGEPAPPKPSERQIAIGEFIEKKRDEQYTDTEIKKQLRSQFPGITAEEVDQALDVDTSVFYTAKMDQLFEQIYDKMPEILKNIRFSHKVFKDKKGVKNMGHGGVRLGEEVLDTLQKHLNEYTSEKQRTLIQVRTEIGRLMRGARAYQALSETEKKEVLFSIDELFGIAEGEVLNARMKILKQQITQRKLGKGELKKEQRAVAAALKDLFPEEVAMPSQWKKVINKLTSLSPEVIKTTMEDLVKVVEKEIEKAKLEKIQDIKGVVKKSGSLRRNLKTNKIQTSGKVSADTQTFFAQAKRVLKAVLIKDPKERQKALDAIAADILSPTQIIETEEYVDPYGERKIKQVEKTIYLDNQPIPELADALEAESQGYPLTMPQKKLLFLKGAYDMLKNLKDLDIKELIELYDTLLDRQKTSRQDLIKNLNERSKKNFDLKLKARREVQKIFGNLVMSEISAPYQPIPRIEQDRYIKLIEDSFDDFNPKQAYRTKLTLTKDKNGTDVMIETQEKIENVEEIELELNGENLKIYRETRTDEDGNALKPKYSVLMRQPTVALVNERRERYPELKKMLDKEKFTSTAKKLMEKYKQNPTAMLNPLGYLGNLEGMTLLLDRPGKSDSQFFYREIKERVDKMTSDANRGFVDVMAHLDEFARTSFEKYKTKVVSLKDILTLPEVWDYFDVPMAKGTQLFSGNELMRIYALSKNDEQLYKMLHTREGEYRITQETLDFINENLPPELRGFVDKVVEFLSGPYYESINEIFKKINNVNLTHIANYFSTKTDSQAAKSAFKALGEGDFSSIFNAQNQTAVKSRMDKTGQVILKDEGFFSTLENHIREMERFKAMAGPVQDLNALMSEAAVRMAMLETGMLDYINFNLNATINPKSMDLGDRTWIDAALRIFVNYVMGMKTVQLFKQATSSIFAFKTFRVFKDSESPLLRFIDKTPVGTAVDLSVFALRMLGILARFTKSIKRAKLISANFKLRWENADLYDLEAPAGTIKKILRPPKSMWHNPIGALMDWRENALMIQNILTKIGDAAGVLGYLALYDQLKANGKSDAEALKAFEKYDTTQQTRRTQDLTKLQLRRNIISRTSVAFGSMGFLQMNNAIPSLRNIISSMRRGKIPTSEDTRSLVLNMFIGNFLFQLAANLYLVATGDEDDDEKTAFSRIFWGTTFGTLTMGIPLLGAALETLLRATVEGVAPKKAAKEQINPFMEFGKRIFRAANKDVWAQDKAEIASLLIAGMTGGIQADPLFGAVAWAKELGYGPEEEGIPRLTDNFGRMLGITYSSRPTMIEGKKKLTPTAARYIMGDNIADLVTSKNMMIEYELEYMDSLKGISETKYENQQKLRRKLEQKAAQKETGYQRPFQRMMHKLRRLPMRFKRWLNKE